MVPQGQELVIATRNEGKVKEFGQMFAPFGIRVKSLNDFVSAPDIVEDGATFAENARIKARAVAEAFGIPALADDSGLCVDELDGAPGVYSARYAGPGATDRDNNAKLLAALKERRTQAPRADAAEGGGPVMLSAARFVCALALYDPASRRMLEAEGACEGFIIEEPRGHGGFGYDPLFYLPEEGLTMAELAPERKNELSHRSKALQALIARLRESWPRETKS